MTVLISAGTNGKNPAVIQKAVKTLSSSAYDRRLESEADKTSVHYLSKANIDPEGFAAFMEKMEARNADDTDMSWISTHPDPGQRAAKIRSSLNRTSGEKAQLLNPKDWMALKAAVEAISIRQQTVSPR
ncbi:MAG: hypothetical protein EOP88_21980 [Verrucomicrobiaceae bacterium]|nr:MAG: hypothetical protein EOP88_21980 [Verrucomicrobiaceae bacterium]